LLVVDAFGDVYSGDINVINSVRVFLNSFSEIIRDYDVAVLFVHHIGKRKENKEPNKNNMLGSAGIEGKARSVLNLSKMKGHPELRILNIVKGNYVAEDIKKTPFLMGFNPITLTYHSVPQDSLSDDEFRNSGSDQSSSGNLRPGRKVDPSLFEEAIRLHKEGTSQVEIAKTVGRDKSTISKWIKKHNDSMVYDMDKGIIDNEIEEGGIDDDDI